MRHRWITEFKFAGQLQRFVAEYNRAEFPEPIPVPSREQIDRAASTVVALNEQLFGHQRFRSLNTKVAAAFYELCKQHFFVNGNKRIATYFLLHLLEVHDWMLNVDPARLAKFAEEVAASVPAERDAVIRKTAVFINNNKITLEQWQLFRDLTRRLR